MKTIGLIGGITWESTVEYYKIINKEIQKSLGGYHSAKLVLASVDFAEIEKAQHNNDWEKVASLIVQACQQVERAGAEHIIICSNTIHKISDQLVGFITIPLVHIADATINALKEKGLKNVGLLGTKFTMEEDFFKDKFTSSGINVMVPNGENRSVVNDIIFQELCFGIIKDSSKEFLRRIIDDLKHNGAEAVILGCTELAFIVQQKDVELLLIDTVKEHAKLAVKLSLQ
ncbi:aspartate racemase [Lottiidibacillus patelloidae]|uniref:Aspartate racemase n=1 Tax=Lottiidibacillus patelloidae TaxID=2670334 RepID=A0A263BS14_9BACI|nr:aspartate/glutamate racemase family protein [Lottiidibacillus patelloidae]OZM56358.1 aspartate racemase [Lottiidibacillus patelloidae]